MPLGAGTDIGHYRVQQLIAQGGLGMIFRAVDKDLQRQVAIKVMTTNSPEAERQMLNEARILARFRHPNIVSVFEYGEFEGMPYVVMDYLEGMPLDVAAPHLTTREAIRTLLQIASALGYAHRLGVVHRDVKPRNIVITPQGNAILIDFFAPPRAMTDTVMTGLVAGTPGYMSPEALLGEEADNRSDVYSLGSVSYEVLTGHRPFGVTLGDIVTAQLSRHAKDPRELNPSIGPKLSHAICKAMAKDPADRWQSMDDFAQAIQEGESEFEEAKSAGPSTPILVTEGKTDVLILKTAWAKLFAGRKCPFDIESCNIVPEHEGSRAGVSILSNHLDHIRANHPFVEIGLFDRDKEGVKQFNRLQHFDFVPGMPDLKVHKNGRAYAVLLPVPPGREDLADPRLPRLSIEFYFDEAVLRRTTAEGRGLSFEPYYRETRIDGADFGKEALTGWQWQRIGNGKLTFAQDIVPTVEPREFSGFQVLFDLLLSIPVQGNGGL